MRVVSVVNQKGGVGKSTTVMNLASIIAEHSRVLVVDVDPQRSVTMWATTADQQPEDRQLAFDVVSETDPQVLTQLRSLDYDTIIVDTPGNLQNTDVLKTVVENSDFVILPTEPAVLALLPLISTYETLIKPSDADYRVVVTKVDSRSLSDATEAQEMLRESGLLVCKSYVRTYKVHERAPMVGQVASNYESNQNSEKAAADYKDVARELLSIWANKDQG
ncbi:ParA family protein [Arthrobacter sp. A2-55]|uniref:ParA family protein n=1 Tax=Arthrobacter sp. A2-55 TaxID=2897337 RepID=UPI0021CD19A5|nr:ParA family protein [Arthrobacter sp. A2-55]MCU6480553.1 ParA family protein [Arthrobacter sp. A2-55]